MSSLMAPGRQNPLAFGCAAACEEEDDRPPATPDDNSAGSAATCTEAWAEAAAAGLVAFFSCFFPWRTINPYTLLSSLLMCRVCFFTCSVSSNSSLVRRIAFTRVVGSRSYSSSVNIDGSSVVGSAVAVVPLAEVMAATVAAVAGRGAGLAGEARNRFQISSLGGVNVSDE